jgi:cation-transporting ATPase I
MIALAAEPHLVHAIPGRVRVHLPAWSGQEQHDLESQVGQEPGVRSVRANPLTRNLLIHFDPAAMDEEGVLTAVRALVLGPSARESSAPPPLPQNHPSRPRRARIAVRGLEGNPRMAARIEEQLQHRPGVRATASPVTGRVLVEWAGQEHATTLEELRSELSLLEPADLGPEVRPSPPLTPDLRVRSATRVAGAALGLGVLVGRRLVGAEGPPIAMAGPAVAAGAIGLLESWAVAPGGPRTHSAPGTSELLLSVAGILSLTLAGSSLGLVIGGVAGLRVLSQVLAQRTAWRRYEERLDEGTPAHPGASIQLEAGERTPLSATVVEGTGTVVGRDGLPHPVAPGTRVEAGAQLLGGPFVLELHGPGESMPRSPAPADRSALERYVRSLGPLSLAYAALTALLTRSPARAFAALLLVNPRAAVIGAEAAHAGASARVLRSGVAIPGTLESPDLRRPGVLLLGAPRLLADGLEVSRVLLPARGREAAELLALASGVAVAAGSPWGSAFRGAGSTPAVDGMFDGRIATARVAGVRYSLTAVEDRNGVPAKIRLEHRGECLLALHREGRKQPLGVLALRPRLAPGVARLVAACRRCRVELGVLAGGEGPAAQEIAGRAGVPLMAGEAGEVIRARQEAGDRVAFVSDSAQAAPGFAASDLAIAITDGHTPFPARVDLLAPGLTAVAAIVETAARHDAAVRDSVALSLLSNGVGAVWGFRGNPGVRRAPLATNLAALGALAAGWARLRGEERSSFSLSHIVDPHPERWGRRGIPEVLRALGTTEAGLTTAQAAERRRTLRPAERRNRLLPAVLDQLRSPLTGILAAGAGVSLFLGGIADAVMITAMLIANAAVGVWQEYRTDEAAEALQRMSTAAARVLRDGRTVTVPADQVVPGDVLLLARGDRVAADARLLSAQGLEVDEAALTGESLPVPKTPAGGIDARRIVLEGSDVMVGTARAVVVAVGRETRMGATAAALEIDERERNTPLSARLNRMLQQVLPVAAAGGAIVAASGILRRQPLASQLALGASVAIAAVPEGLTLLAALGEAAVARRLATRNALVRRPSAVEALGRVDVVCTDKTGTLTEGRLALSLVADIDQEVRFPATLPPHLRHVLLTAALAGPHPDAPDAAADPTDLVVARAAEEAGFRDELWVERGAKSPFRSSRSFHAAVAGGRLCVEGAAEALVSRCSHGVSGGNRRPLDEGGRRDLLARARHFAERGLRVLMVAEGPPDASVDDPCGLLALGFLGINDPLRPGVAAAVQRCQEAGVRVIMITGDHPATARAIAREAGLLGTDGEVLTGGEIAELRNGELDRRLERASVVARATPVDKLRIIESLQRRGHTVAMTGDGVNDAPALRLADVGVAMGRGGTEVARQAADVVLADDDFSTLVETFVEGRSFWRNIRRALGLLLGGNLGELGMEVGASALGLAPPLTSHQILAMNLMTDVLPALAVVLQQPEHRDLASLAREGTSALDAPLRNEVFSRGTATAAPSLAAYLIGLRTGGVPFARTAAFASIITTQLAQTLDAGWAEGSLTPGIRSVVIGSTGALVGILTLRPLRDFLGLVRLTPFGWALVGVGTVTAVLLGRVLPPPAAASQA